MSTATNPNAAAAAARAASTKKGPAKPRGAGGSAGGASNSGMLSLRLYSDDAPGLKVGPTVILVTSLVYIAIVIILHVWAKFR
mmetsp:Transcript_7978/g.19917  ORF Transcript_7978/g.19917 Transcript_7978/m.19917 type:complete len:83 (-) Transcript_7978:99-347(-)